MPPGIAGSTAGGWLGARFGEGWAAVAGLLTMAVSGVAIAAPPLILFLGFGPALYAARGRAEAKAGPAVGVFGWRLDATGDPVAPFALSAVPLVATALAALASERGLAPAVRRS
ncbi:MAG TPA: hypothetical protein VJ994_08405 [Paracoccaceae bacterium]|nr:hypothetical protein [Paracoccaceae bacterium]